MIHVHQLKEYKSDLKPIWCPGCGDFGVLQALYRALTAVGRPPHEIAFVSGIGCSSRIPGYTTAYGFNSLHGRALPIAQGTPADLPGLAALIEEAIRFPGFSFVNVQSPCVTYGEDDQQIKAQKAKMKSLQSLGHDPSNRIHAMDLAQHYGTELHTGVFYRNPAPPPTFESLVGERQRDLARDALPRERILDLFLQR